MAVWPWCGWMVDTPHRGKSAARKIGRSSHLVVFRREKGWVSDGGCCRSGRRGGGTGEGDEVDEVDEVNEVPAR